MTDDHLIDNVVDLYKARICAALDQMPLDDIRLLVADIEARIEDPRNSGGTRRTGAT
jgi:hypothetical protein